MDLGSGDVRIGIVGSRCRTDREAIEAYIGQLASDTVVVTGGAQGPDQWAEKAARTRGLAVAVHKPDLEGAVTRWQMTDRYYARNQRIVNDSDLIVAFVAPDRVGGTEDTIRRATRAGKPAGGAITQMKRLKLTKARQERFLASLAATGNVTAAVATAGTSRLVFMSSARSTQRSPPAGKKLRKSPPTRSKQRRGGVPSKAYRNRW
jgi:hypothetical protein